ncbi:uncharacterized protein [Coffea arabica]|uniref:LysM domain-containing protein n=1 Tax=Coffea arabica TaxID=13443 RepID=A0A6P6UNA4_COFAR|nr:uncharacterized protein LOC113712102 [Coffea arabica]
MEFKLSQSSLPRTLVVIRSSVLVKVSRKVSNHKNFRLHAQRWRCQIRGMSSKGRHSVLKHVVKEGETLTSISKLYGVAIYEIAAANKDIVDVDLVFEGQHLNIPLSTAVPLQMQKSERALSSDPSLDERTSRLELFSSCLNQKMFSFLSVHNLSYAKSTGYFLVLVPLIAFCIRCIIGALCNRVAGDMKHNVNESEEHHHGSKRIRWKFALQDLKDPDALDTGTRPDYDYPSEDEAQVNTKDLSQDYSELERDYEKFLSECGISRWGYWRGGSPT